MRRSDFVWGSPGLFAVNWSTLENGLFGSSVEAFGFTQSGALGKSPAFMTLELNRSDYLNHGNSFPLNSDGEFRNLFDLVGSRRVVSTGVEDVVFTLSSNVVLSDSGVWTSVRGPELRKKLVALADFWERGEEALPVGFEGWYKMPSRK